MERWLLVVGKVVGVRGLAVGGPLKEQKIVTRREGRRMSGGGCFIKAAWVPGITTMA